MWAGVGSQRARSRNAQQDVAWLELGKGAAWWLGEYANVATGEFAGSPQSQATDSYSGDGGPEPMQENLPPGSTLDAIALQVRSWALIFSAGRRHLSRRRPGPNLEAAKQLNAIISFVTRGTASARHCWWCLMGRT